MSEARAFEAQIDELMSQLTLQEKVSLLSGNDAWNTMPIERLGIPSLTVTDGPHGVRANRTGPERVQGPATSFPTGVSMAATWNTELIQLVGEALAEETLAMGCQVLLGPCVNIMRTPLAGRNFESYSEDPYLSGRTGVAWVSGLQSRGVGASLKHFACNNQEVERMRGSSVVDERALREIYLPAFEAVVKEVQPWTVMCSYNRINGVYASENRRLLTEILREEWGFGGAVVSDWGAVHSTVGSVGAGLDIEMPGPARYYGDLLFRAVRMWQIDEAIVDEAVRRVLRLLARAGKLPGATHTSSPGAVNTAAHQELARRVAQESIVLLKNSGAVLPLDPVDLRSLAVIGPNATEARIGGGGSSYLEPPYRVSPLEGLQAAVGERVSITYELGCDNHEEPPAVSPHDLVPAEGEGEGLWAEYFANASLEGEPSGARVEPNVDYVNLRPIEGVSRKAFAVRWSGSLIPPRDGRHLVKLVAAGHGRLYLGGELVLSTEPIVGTDPLPMEQGQTHVDLMAGEDLGVRVEYVKPPHSPIARVRLLLSYDPLPEDDDRLERAVAQARRSDVALIFGGMPRGFESEGYDRPHMRLPGRQDELIRAVAAANPRTVVVLNCGSPVEMPWLDEVAAVILAWYPGQEGGNALADVLLGNVNPSGKLPVTFPRRYVDNPTYINYPGTKQVHYGEGIFVGYRYYDMKDIEPLFPFGHGLSYTTFEYSALQLPTTQCLGEPLEIGLTVANTGEFAGKEVVQCYVRDVESSLTRPPKELAAFAKAALAPGERKEIRFSLDRRSLSFYDPYLKRWRAEPGEFEIQIGSSSRDIRLRGKINISE